MSASLQISIGLINTINVQLSGRFTYLRSQATMKILAFERELPGVEVQQFQQYAQEEAQKVWLLYQAGLIRELYFRADQDMAILVLECASTDEALVILADLPFVRQGLIAFDLIPLRAYPGFDRLFRVDDTPRARR